MVLNLEGAIPALIFLVLHFLLDFSILWFIGALAVWILGLIFWMKVIGWAGRCSTLDLPRENKNPYSVGARKSDHGQNNETDSENE